MGATNRKFHIDEAILSRMSLQFEIKLPNYEHRVKIFKKMIKSMNVDNLDVDYLASITNSFSGRDIDDVCREASMICLRQYLKNKEKNKTSSSTSVDKHKSTKQIRKISINDFITAIQLKKKDFNSKIALD